MTAVVISSATVLSLPGLTAQTKSTGPARHDLAEQTLVAQSDLCPAPALTRLQQHTVASGETLDGIAEQYRLIPATLIGFNPALRQRALQRGDRLTIPPFNGIQVQVPSGQTWSDLAAAYGIGADVLFEINGCAAAVPEAIFVPGINWFPGINATGQPTVPANHPLQGYPLSQRAQIILPFGWQPDPAGGGPIFSGGVALAAIAESPVLAVGEGTVAYAGSAPEEAGGNLVVINHAQGLQTRYANLDRLLVRVGQRVNQTAILGYLAADHDATRDASTEPQAALYFEVRLNSELGWVAQNPQQYIPELGLR
ncbi:MAG: M23 family metallopeptidase [Cyanobacteria bacterium P01_D01_bin.128]